MRFAQQPNPTLVGHVGQILQSSRSSASPNPLANEWTFLCSYENPTNLKTSRISPCCFVRTLSDYETLP